jgi:hypothetical protein
VKKVISRKAAFDDNKVAKAECSLRSDAYMTYPGGKNGTGTFQKIINQMPPHDVYIEAFLGSGAVMRLKRPATLGYWHCHVCFLCWQEGSIVKYDDGGKGDRGWRDGG